MKYYSLFPSSVIVKVKLKAKKDLFELREWPNSSISGNTIDDDVSLPV